LFIRWLTVHHQIAGVGEPVEPERDLAIRMTLEQRDQKIHDAARDGQEVVQRVRGQGDGMNVERGQHIDLRDRMLQIDLRAADRVECRLLRVADRVGAPKRHGCLLARRGASAHWTFVRSPRRGAERPPEPGPRLRA
jgi:hypothetical protein